MGLHDVVKTHYTGPTRDVNLCNYRRLFFVSNLLSSAPGPRGLVFFFCFFFCFVPSTRTRDVRRVDNDTRHARPPFLSQGLFFSQRKTLKNKAKNFRKNVWSRDSGFQRAGRTKAVFVSIRRAHTLTLPTKIEPFGWR